jgi:hypothetical protein
LTKKALHHVPHPALAFLSDMPYPAPAFFRDVPNPSGASPTYVPSPAYASLIYKDVFFGPGEKVQSKLRSISHHASTVYLSLLLF